MRRSAEPVPPRSPDAGQTAWRERLQRFSRDFADVRRTIKRRLGILAPLRIAMYGGYGTSNGLVLRGRVLEARDGVEPSTDDGPLLNFKRSFWQFESDEVANVELSIELLGGLPEQVPPQAGA